MHIFKLSYLHADLGVWMSYAQCHAANCSKRSCQAEILNKNFRQNIFPRMKAKTLKLKIKERRKERDWAHSISKLPVRTRSTTVRGRIPDNLFPFSRLQYVSLSPETRRIKSFIQIGSECCDYVKKICEELTRTYRYFSDLRLPRVEGMEPDKELLYRSKLTRLVRLPSDAGMTPLMLFSKSSLQNL